MNSLHPQQVLFWTTSIVVVSLLFVWAIVGENGIVSRRSLQLEYAAELREVERIKVCNRYLEYKLFRLDEYPTEIATAVHERLLMAPEGSRIYLFNDQDQVSGPCDSHQAG